MSIRTTELKQGQAALLAQAIKLNGLIAKRDITEPQLTQQLNTVWVEFVTNHMNSKPGFAAEVAYFLLNVSREIAQPQG